eukprot:TRINITY_DN507_c0_g1_i1.p1 TRINITY_DN507_c0_g1~~TRINITY_DN507_c0_g1_i1.p1  ORF type:complete len:532 (+),score=150.78 TRINITY_DN507_c0_g1_i1:98-1597(+)
MSDMDKKRMRDRSPREDRRRDRRVGGRGGGGGEGSGGKPTLRRAPPERRVFVSNFPFEMKWQEIKDMFRKEVGDVTYVELFNDEQERPRGCGIMEFATPELAKKCIEKMHRFEYKGRKLVVKEDFDTVRDKCGRIVGSRSFRDKSRDRSHERPRESRPIMSGGGDGGDYENTYGLSPQFLESLDISGSLHHKIFVANLSYEVDERKLKEVFRLAGKVVMIDLTRDKSGKSRGFAVLEYSHPVEAVQAISMFNNQVLFERRLTVRFDNQNPYENDEELPARLPEGLEGVGMGLGSNGDPLTDVARNLPSLVENVSPNQAQQQPQMPQQASGGSGSGLGNNMDMALAVSNMATLARTMGLNLGNLGMSSGGNLPNGGGAGNAASLLNNSGGMGSSGMGGSSGGYSTGGNNPSSVSSNYPPPASSGGPRGGSDSVIIRNLPMDCNWQALRDGFSHCGEIKYAEMKERTTGLIRFISERDADRAVSMMDKQVIGSRTIDVRLY